MSTVSNRIIRFPEVRSLTGLSRSTLYLRISEGLFPQAINLGVRMVGWGESEVLAVNAARTRGASADEIRQLVVALLEARKAAA